MQRAVLALALLGFACATTTSVTRTGTGLFAPRENTAEAEDEAPRGLSLAVASIARDGIITLDLRNYSMEPFTFAGTPERPAIIIEADSGDTHSRHTVSGIGRSQTHEVPAGERIQLKTSIGGAEGRVRIGIRSREFGYTVWTDWFAP